MRMVRCVCFAASSPVMLSCRGIINSAAVCMCAVYMLHVTWAHGASLMSSES